VDSQTVVYTHVHLFDSITYTPPHPKLDIKLKISLSQTPVALQSTSTLLPPRVPHFCSVHSDITFHGSSAPCTRHSLIH
jgi:hypothetical protein